MKKLRVRLILLSVILMGGFGCTTVKILNVNKEANFSFSDYKTYDFYAIDIDTTAYPEFNKRFLILEEELMKQLGSNGLKRSVDNPDLLINIGAKLESKIQTRQTDLRTDAFYMGQRNYKWETTDVPIGEYHEGTYTIDFVEAKDKTLKCMVVAEGVIVKKEKDSKKNTTVALEKMFKKINKN